MRTDMSPAKNYNLFVTRIPKLFLLAVLMSLLATALGSSRVLTAASAGGGSQNTDAVWFWFGDCLNGTPMGVRITVEGQNVYHSTFRACRMERVDANTEKEKRIRVFHFPGGHTFQDTYRTNEGEKIEGNIWQAGADPDDILLGVSFVAHGQILLNTIHIVQPGKPTQSTLDRDLVIKTYPLKSRAVQ
jgi:hypothetical protein